MKKKLNPTIKLASHQVLEVLREKMFAGDAWAWLTEVRNGTGYSRAARSADALAVSCWPSRGLFASGVEVKVSRSDWKRELLEPAKSDEVQRFCRYWWIATSPGIVIPDELPPTWGLVETDGKTCSVIKAAPELEAKDPTWLFVASVLRNGAKTSEQALNIARAEGHAKGMAKADEMIADYREKIQEIRAMDSLKARVQTLESSIEEFRALTGITVGSWHDRKFAALIRTAKLFADLDLLRLSENLKFNSDRMANAAAELSRLAVEAHPMEPSE